MTPSEQTECQHLSGEATVDFRKVVTVDDQSKIVGREIVINVWCKDCGMVFHFPHFTPMTKDNPGVNADATKLRLTIRPGPATVLWTLPTEDEEESVIHNN